MKPAKRFGKRFIREVLSREVDRRKRLQGAAILAAGIIHEIKNPLTTIKTFTDFLPFKYDDPEFREKFCRIVSQEIQRAKDIVSNLMSSGFTEIRREPCDVNKVVRYILEILTHAIARADIRVELRLERCEIFVDTGQIKQALLNIVMNAVDSMKMGGGRLSIRTRKQNDLVEIVVEDTGCGISRERLARIYEPFYTDKNEGMGLGLSVTRSLILENDGEIRVSSRSGRGTRFVILLPMAGQKV